MPHLGTGSGTVEVVFVADGGDPIVNPTHRDLLPYRETSHREGWERCLAVLVLRRAGPSVRDWASAGWRFRDVSADRRMPMTRRTRQSRDRVK